MYQINITRDEAVELFNFIVAHLEVVNDTPYVEQLMMDLEEQFDL